VGMVCAETLQTQKHPCKHQKMPQVCPTSDHDPFCLVKGGPCCPYGKGMFPLVDSLWTVSSGTNLLKQWEQSPCSEPSASDLDISGFQWNGGGGTALLRYSISHFKFIPLSLTKSSLLC
jgi:hypothetical protein